MNKDLKNILAELRKIIPFIREKYSVNSIEVFGSFARNEQKNKSDLDLLVTFSETPGLLKFIELENYISDKLNIKVDLVMKDSLKPLLKRNILSEAIRI